MNREEELFKALFRNSNNVCDVYEKLEAYVAGEEYKLAHDGGEPDLAHLLAIRFLEKLRGKSLLYSIVYSRDYIEHIEESIGKEEE